MMLQIFLGNFRDLRQNSEDSLANDASHYGVDFETTTINKRSGVFLFFINLGSLSQDRP